MPSETTTACVRLFVFFRIGRSTFPYGVEDDASTISQTPTTHYTSTCVKLTIVTYLSFSERIAIANVSLYEYDGNGPANIRKSVAPDNREYLHLSAHVRCAAIERRLILLIV